MNGHTSSSKFAANTTLEAEIFGFYTYLLLSLVKLVNRERGKNFFVGVLIGTKSRKLLKVISKKDLWGFYNLLSLAEHEDLESLLDAQFAHGFIELHEVWLDGFKLPLVCLAQPGEEYLMSEAETYSARLESMLSMNLRSLALHRPLMASKLQVSGFPEFKSTNG